MAIRTVDQIELKGKRVFIRVDFNVPQDEKNNITDDTRILLSLPTIRFASDAGGKVVLASHLGRPKGKKDPKFSLAPVAARLSQLAGEKSGFSPGLHWRRGSEANRRNERRRRSYSWKTSGFTLRRRRMKRLFQRPWPLSVTCTSMMLLAPPTGLMLLHKE